MKNVCENFADGIGKIHFVGGQVRFDFVTVQPENNGKNGLKSVIRIVMPAQGFLGAFNAMQQLIEKLLSAGVLQKNEPVPEAKPVSEKSPSSLKKSAHKHKKNKKK